jgi:2,4-dienoyl-CoA reductase-like NADH-dependent reductase (Old Yellow Enzyme family)
MPNGSGFKNQFYAGDDLYIPSLTRVAQAIQLGGAKAVLQMFHPGRMASKADLGGNQIVSASAVKSLREGSDVPRALTEPEIHNIIDSFYDATRRAILAGFDGVEIHGANTYLIQQFFSPHSNRRNDYWGGDLERRMRFPIAIISSVKRAISDYGSPKFIIGYRFSPEEIESPGICIEDTLKFIDILSDLGLTYLNISLGQYNQKSMVNPNNKIPIGKQVLDVIRNRVPLLGVGGITTREEAENALDFGFDLIQLGRTIVLNPDWVERVKINQPLRGDVSIEEAKALYIPVGLLEKIEATEGWFPIRKD